MKRLIITIAIALTTLGTLGADERFVGTWDLSGMAFVERGDDSEFVTSNEGGFQSCPFATFKADGTGIGLLEGNDEPFKWYVEEDLVYLVRPLGDPLPARFQVIDRDTILMLEVSGSSVNVAVLKRATNR